MGHINLIYESGWKALAKFNPAPLHLDALDVVVEDDPQICNGDKWNYQQCPIRSLKVDKTSNNKHQKIKRSKCDRNFKDLKIKTLNVASLSFIYD